MLYAWHSCSDPYPDILCFVDIMLLFQVNEILTKPATVEEGGVYCYSERGDHLIELVAFRDRLWQVLNLHFVIHHHICTALFWFL
mgnify:FL=1